MYTKALLSFIAVFFTISSIAQSPSLEYMVHMRTHGWNQGWVQEGKFAGLAKKKIQHIGDTANGQGVTNEFRDDSDDRKRLEAIKIRLKNAPSDAHIEYRAHSQSHGWMPWVRDGQVAGTTGLGKRMEAIQIRLVNMPNYTVRYKVKFESRKSILIAQKPLNDGLIPTEWGPWINEGQVAGTVGESRRLSHIIIDLVEK